MTFRRRPRLEIEYGGDGGGHVIRAIAAIDQLVSLRPFARRQQPLDLPPVEGRRKSELITPVPKPRKQKAMSPGALAGFKPNDGWQVRGN